MDILDEAVRKSGKTVSEYVRELICLGGNVDFRYPEDRQELSDFCCIAKYQSGG